MPEKLSIKESFFNAMEDFANATNLAVVVVDIDGNELSPRFNFSFLCNKIRKQEHLYDHCKNCDRLGGLNALKNQDVGFYRCHAGLVDFSVPLLVKGKLIGFIQCGQAKVDDIDELPLISDRIELDSVFMDTELKQLYKETETIKLSRLIACAKTLKTLSEVAISDDFELDRTNSEIVVMKSSELNSLESKLKIEEAINYINNNLFNTLSLELVASHVNLSTCYFSRLFKAHTKIGLNKYVNKQRLSSAKRILKNKQLSINAVSQKCGFQSPSYFIRQFKLEYNVTPQEYRQNLLDA